MDYQETSFLILVNHLFNLVSVLLFFSLISMQGIIPGFLDEDNQTCSGS